MKSHPVVLSLMGMAWLILIGAGLAVMAHEEFTPVETLQPVTYFPHGSALHLASDKPTLFLFAHPHCPCTRATFDELDQVMAETAGKLSIQIIFTLPPGVPPGWEQGDLLKWARSFPGVQVVFDRAGAESRRFDVKGSGHVLVYSPAGRLLFSGGITSSRGHEGDSPGRSAIVSLVTTGHARIDRTPVFGCSLL
jgi:hypothetical protein